MKKTYLILFITILFSSCSMINHSSSLFGSSSACLFPDTAEKVLPSVVQVTVVDSKYQKIPEGWDFSYNPFDPSPDSLKDNNREFQDEGLGSGIVVKKQGSRYFILTNRHVIGDAEKISVTVSDGTVYPASVAGIDERQDLALISLESEKPIPVISWGDSDSLKVGEWVMAIGSPYGYYSSVTAGIISALGRKNSNGGNISDFIQTDASINHGNSGGALVNLKGELIGINSWITTPTGGSIGLGFALPSNNAVKTVSDIINYGDVRYGWVGLIGGEILQSEIRYYDSNSEINGVFIFQTVIDDPAYRYGLFPGDIVTAVDDIKINDVDLFTRVIGNIGAGEETSFTVLRNSTLQNINIITDLRPKNSDLLKKTSVYWPGISVITLNDSNLQLFDTGNLKSGVIVASIEKNPYFDFFESGDIITEINSIKINNIKDFYSSLKSHDEKNIIKYYRNDIEYIKNSIK